MLTRRLLGARSDRSAAGAQLRSVLGGPTCRRGRRWQYARARVRDRAIVHATVREFWLVLSGRGVILRRDESCGELIVLTPGVLMAIPVGTAFLYRCAGAEALRFLCIRMPPWPGHADATIVEGPWVPRGSVGPVCSVSASCGSVRARPRTSSE